MSHIFISYSRRDLDFAQKIVDALSANDLDTWIDWKSIPKGEDWKQEIYQGIEEADAFLFLISPDSVESRPCNNEITHAIRNGKRILPIFISSAESRGIYHVTEKFLEEENQKEISRRNFILCREGIDDFNKAIVEIRTTIHTDYEWLKYHTELQVKALRWEQHKDDSRLLRGRELREAEDKLTGIDSQKDPQPTELQRRHVLYSRRNEERQQRQLTLGLSFGLITVGLLALFAWGQRNYALSSEATAIAEANARATAQVLAERESRDRATAQVVAEKQTELAIAQKLVFQSQSLTANQQSLSLLLSAQANNMHSDLSSLSGLLYALLAKPHNQKYFYYQNMDYTYTPIIKFSRNNKFVAALFDYWREQNEKVVVWNLKGGTQVYSEQFSYEDGHQAISDIHFRNETELLLEGMSQKAILLDFSRGNQSEVAINLKAQAFSNDGQFVVGIDDSGISIWQTAPLSLKQKVVIPGIEISRTERFLLSGNNQKLLILLSEEDTKEKIVVYDLALEKISSTIHIESEPSISDIAVSPSADLIAILLRYQYPNHVERELRVVDLETGEIVWKFSKRMRDIKFIDDQTILANEPDGITYYASRTGGQLNRVAAPGKNTWDWSSWPVFYSSDGKYAAYVLDDSFVVIDLYQINLGIEIQSPYNDIDGLKFSLDNKYLAFSSSDGHVIYASVDGDTKREVQVSENQGTFRWTNALDGANQNIAIIVNAKGNVDVWDIHNGIHSYELPEDSYEGIIDYVLDKNVLAIGYQTNDNNGNTSGVVNVWDLDNKKITDQIFINSDDSLYPYGSWINALALSPNNRYLAIAVYASVSIYDLESRQFILHTPSLHSNDIMKLVYSPNGKVLASSSSDGSVILWDMQTGQAIGKTIFANNVISLAFSPDGKILATGDHDNTEIILWNTSTRERVGPPLLGHTGSIVQLEFSSDGKYIASADSNGKLIVWMISPSILSSVACSVANRNLTLQEWSQYIGAIPYQATCPDRPIPTE